ncbi:MAG: hypothetical protein JJ921_06745 [Pseudomonadales bacterium]|nr:hypothetical protein [Pseudomonadales bacterium]MBO7007063.1 hypothetical protein [Pseudomonadales bacterium]
MENEQPLKTFIICVALATLILNWLPGLDAAAETYLADAITDNLIIFATARSLNAIISVIQSIELSVSLGAGMAVNLGEVLDPLNDLIERFSGFVLYGLAGLGLQKLVLVATSSLIMKIITTIAILGGLVNWLWQPERFQWLPRLVLMILMIRFAFVVEVGLIAGLDKLYFDGQKAEAHSALQLAQQSLSNLKDEYQEIIADQGFVSGTWEAAGSLFGTEEQSGITEITASAVVELIVITLVRGLLLPLAFVWLLIVVAGRLSGLSHYPPRQPV